MACSRRAYCRGSAAPTRIITSACRRWTVVQVAMAPFVATITEPLASVTE